jgi:hypothetical protein
LFIAVTLLFPRGLVCAWNSYVSWMRQQKPDPLAYKSKDALTLDSPPARQGAPAE